MVELNLPPQAEAALNRLQDTTLSPMEEVLFKAWTKANQIEEPDDPNDIVDYRGIYRSTNGAVLPAGEIAKQAEMLNHKNTLEKALQERMMKRMEELVGKEEDQANQMHKEERQDITHKQKMEMEGLKLKRAPHDLKMKEHDVRGKEIGLQKQDKDMDLKRIDNEGKQIDLMATLLQPKRPNQGGTSENKSGNSERSS